MPIKINLITFVGEDIQVLPHMLDHYRNEGVTNLMLHVHGTTDQDPIFENVAKIAKNFGAQIVSKSIGEWWLLLNSAFQEGHRLKNPNEWYVIADVDELQGYHGELHSMIAYCELNGYNYIEGCFVDRLTEDGSLPQVSESKPIWDQFPMGGMISTTINGAVANKIVVAKGHIRTGVGHHFAKSGRGCPPEELYVPVYHFKWTDGIIDRLSIRANEKRMLGVYRKECERVVAYFRQYSRLDISSPAMMIAPCAPRYQHWQAIQRARVSAKNFHPALLDR